MQQIDAQIGVAIPTHNARTNDGNIHANPKDADRHESALNATDPATERRRQSNATPARPDGNMENKRCIAAA
jgi:hypothetical protein